MKILTRILERVLTNTNQIHVGSSPTFPAINLEDSSTGRARVLRVSCNGTQVVNLLVVSSG